MTRNRRPRPMAAISAPGPPLDRARLPGITRLVPTWPEEPAEQSADVGTAAAQDRQGEEDWESEGSALPRRSPGTTAPRRSYGNSRL